MKIKTNDLEPIVFQIRSDDDSHVEESYPTFKDFINRFILMMLYFNEESSNYISQYGIPDSVLKELFDNDNSRYKKLHNNGMCCPSSIIVNTSRKMEDILSSEIFVTSSKRKKKKYEDLYPDLFQDIDYFVELIDRVFDLPYIKENLEFHFPYCMQVCIQKLFEVIKIHEKTTAIMISKDSLKKAILDKALREKDIQISAEEYDFVLNNFVITEYVLHNRNFNIPFKVVLPFAICVYGLLPKEVRYCFNYGEEIELEVDLEAKDTIFEQMVNIPYSFVYNKEKLDNVTSTNNLEDYTISFEITKDNIKEYFSPDKGDEYYSKEYSVTIEFNRDYPLDSLVKQYHEEIIEVIKNKLSLYFENLYITNRNKDFFQRQSNGNAENYPYYALILNFDGIKESLNDSVLPLQFEITLLVNLLSAMKYNKNMKLFEKLAPDLVIEEIVE